LRDIIVDTFDITDSDDNETISIQDNNSVEEDWDPKREADLILNKN
ncbi:15629_t:CDS:1, partial [Funneliformis mosseae]